MTDRERLLEQVREAEYRSSEEGLLAKQWMTSADDSGVAFARSDDVQ